MATINDGTTAHETFSGTSPVSGSAPSLSSDGQPLEMLQSLTVQLETADAIRTLSGAGSLDCYVYDGGSAKWSRLPAGDLAVTASMASKQTVTFPSFFVGTPRNARIKWVPNGVTFSAGIAGVKVWQLGYSKAARGVYP